MNDLKKEISELENSLPTNIKAKLQKIEKLHRKIHQLVSEIEEWKPILEDSIAGSEGWTWFMYYDSHEREFTVKDMEKTILEALKNEKPAEGSMVDKKEDVKA